MKLMAATRVRKAATRVAASCVAFKSRQLGRLVSRIYDDALREHEMTAAQFGLLAAIELAAPIQPVRLGKWLEIDKSTLSRNLRLLMDCAWVKATPTDAGRGQVLRLTTRGQDAVLRAMPGWEKAQATCRRQFGAGAAKALDELLETGRNS